MTFLPGNKIATGRPKGSVNKRTREFEAILEKNDFNPAEAQIDCYRKAEFQYEEAAAEDRIDDALKSLKIMSETSRDLSGYAYPKLKSVDYKQSSEWVNLTTLEQYKAVTVLQSELKKKLEELSAEPISS